MSDTDHTDEFERGWKNIYSIWFSMLMALFFYLIVGLFIKDRVNLGVEESTVNVIRFVLYPVSVITIGLTGYLRKRILNPVRPVSKYHHFSDNPAVAKYTTATVVTLALSESIAIYGLALFLLGQNNLDLYILILISAAAMIYFRPFKEELFRLDTEMRENSFNDT